MKKMIGVLLTIAAFGTTTIMQAESPTKVENSCFKELNKKANLSQKAYKHAIKTALDTIDLDKLSLKIPSIHVGDIHIPHADLSLGKSIEKQLDSTASKDLERGMTALYTCLCNQKNQSAKTIGNTVVMGLMNGSNTKALGKSIGLTCINAMINAAIDYPKLCTDYCEYTLNSADFVTLVLYVVNIVENKLDKAVTIPGVGNVVNKIIRDIVDDLFKVEKAVIMQCICSSVTTTIAALEDPAAGAVSCLEKTALQLTEKALAQLLEKLGNPEKLIATFAKYGVNKTQKEAEALAGKFKSGISKAKDATNKAVKSVSKKMKKAGKVVKKTAKKATHDVKKTAKKAADDVKHAAENVGDDIASVF